MVTMISTIQNMGLINIISVATINLMAKIHDWMAFSEQAPIHIMGAKMYDCFCGSYIQALIMCTHPYEERA